MLRFLLLSFIIATSASAQLSEMLEELDKSRTAMETAHKKVVAAIKANDHQPEKKAAQLVKLKKAQKAWEIWVDLETDVVSDIQGEGSSRLTAEEGITHNITLTNQRTKHLLELASEEAPVAQNAEAKLIKPQRGNPLRKTLCNALRPSIEKEIGVKKPIFVIHSMRVIGNWAFMHTTPKTAKGGDINWKKTKYREEFEIGSDDIAVALLKKNSDGKWQVETFGIGGTDVWWLGWKEKYNLPQNLLHDE